ncbi:Eco57I restriction-modification methylase domain-containing protein [Candidatus Nitrotoga sp. AM1P]|uniref:Eco57I restriction-modification methylase domain-containing protein n=1 Tax=Candidatus Nitrotoga sp. AM1P TaxID=2559597 RepID=UPI0010BB1253|nr:Eco57I restriction-modification methylase domain-containing protein [Candidatus Nitrotoga sp. AM1P]BBJ23049.1 SAM-dependent methyltransferase [Candidatus Nitrotoga sp. AM1P]
MLQLLEHADNVRRKVAPLTAQKHKAEFGQFLTPSSVARFMASLFPVSSRQTCTLLDAGAGVGALSCAFLDRWAAGGFGFAKVEACAYEIDPAMRMHLAQTMAAYGERLAVKSQIMTDDFIEHAAMLCKQGQGGFTHAILNPPYKKINSNSAHRLTLRAVGIETVNLYSAFVALAVALAAPGGQIVAIIPRSFCNGPYYRPFRDFIFERAAIRHMHLFESRSKAFKDDDVLQENIILLLERGGQQGDVTVTTSTDDSFDDLVTNTHPFKRIVFPDDSERFIHVPTSQERNAIELSTAIRYSLEDIGIKASTGPVVDFRLKEHLREMPESGTVPLLYPAHFSGQNIEWPKPGIKKPNAIQRNAETEKWLYPNGFYCVVRRFSSKEEKRRIVASVVQPDTFGDSEMLGLENHLNVYHENKHGLPEALARGLAMYLNMTGVDENFRRSSGHTQVNATDLKMMKYPSRKALMALGEWALRCGEPTQDMIDEQLNNLTA